MATPQAQNADFQRIIKEKPRLFYIDLLRATACFLVVLRHSAIQNDDPMSNIMVGLVVALGLPSSELFLSLSGTVLLPVKKSMGEFYKRRFMKLLPPFIFWSICFIILKLLINEYTLRETIWFIFCIPVKPAIDVYWFIYVMIGLYLLAPLISPWLLSATRKQLEFVICLWLVNLLMPYLNLFTGLNINLNHYFTLNYFGGFLGYWLTGYYLNKYPIKIGWNTKFISLLCVNLAFFVLLFIIRFKTSYNPSMFVDNLMIGSAFIVMLLYTIAQNIKIKSLRIRQTITNIAKFSFGIYLIHTFVIRFIFIPIFEQITINPIISTIIIAFGGFAFSYLIIKGISYLPNAKYIIGI